MGAVGRRRGGVAGAPLISAAAADADVEALRELFREYAAWLGERGWFPDLEGEIAALPGGYDVILVAREAGEPIGCVALKPLPDGACELKRLYVRSGARGRGLGRSLAEAAVGEARRLGYAILRLDTLPAMEAASAIYASLGFVPTERFNDNPIEGVIFFELAL